MPFQETTQSPHDAAFELIEMGYLPACVPAQGPSGMGVYVTTGFSNEIAYQTVGEDASDLDRLSVAFVAIRMARREAEQNGLHPVD